MNPLSSTLLDPLLAPFVVLAKPLDPVPAPGDVKPGWGAVVLVVGLLLVTALLWFSMRKQLGKIRFAETPDRPDDASTPGEPSEPRRENGAGGPV